MKENARNFFGFGSRPFRNFTIGSLLFFFVLVGYLTNEVLDYNKREILNNTRNSLFSILQTTTEGLKIWMAAKKKYMTQVGESTLLVKKVKRLLDVPPNTNELLESRELADVRQLFKNTRKRFDKTGFFIINKDFISIGSKRNDSIGTLNVIAETQPDLLERVFEGETVFAHPIRSDIYLQQNKPATSQSPSTIFIVAPIRDTDGSIIAALARRLDPTQDFSRVIQLGRIGDTGETYAFSNEGKLLSESRFDEDLRNIGLIKHDEKGILAIDIRDPGGNMVTGYQPEILRHQQPLTKMAKSATRGEADEDMTGYRDYRGVPVYGVWLWDSLLGFGITTEIDVEEALLPYRVVSLTMTSLLVIVLFFSSAVMIFTLFFGERAYRILQNSRRDLEDKVLQRTADLRENEKKLSKALEASKAATRAKSSFLANMSHEIRTPMNAIIGFSEILVLTELDTMQSKYLNTINRSAKSLLSLLNDILDIAKLEEGRIKIEMITFNLPQVIENALATMSIKAQEKKLTVNLHYDSRLSDCFIGDPARLRQVLINLIGNAIKFTATGSVSVYVEPSKEKDFVHFMIKDTGIGIPKIRLQAIFAPFTQADTSTTRKYGGTGLGTTISRQIVECMNGKIWVNSIEEEGSTFHFTVSMPLADCVAPLEASVKKQTEFRATQALEILLAEDIPENAELATIRLEAFGHHVTVAENGVETVEQFKKESYDIVLMDVQMPRMDGLEATREMRKIEAERGGHTPIIALSASALETDKAHCIKAGMDGFIGKPIDFDELFSEISRFSPTDSGQLFDELKESPQKNNISLPELAGIDTKLGLKNWSNPERYCRSLFSFAHNHQQDDSLIKQALDAADLKTAKQIIHALKGVAGNLAITNVTSIATDFNEALKKKQDNYNSLLAELNKALKEVIVAIDLLENDMNVNTHRVKSIFNASKVKKRMQDLLVALATDDPDNIEPVLDELKNYLEVSHLKSIIYHVENFSFREAEISMRDLVKELNIDMDNEYGK